MSESKTVVVSGGTYGIGRGIVVELARRGWNVLGFGLDSRQPGSAAEGGVEDTRRALADAGLAGEILQADVSRATDVERVMEHALSCFGRVHGVVNNAAIRPTGTILETDEAMFDRVIEVNLKGQFLLCKVAIAHMREAGGGAIVNIGSGAGWGKAGLLAYGASKGGVFALSSALAYDHLVDRVRINVVVPGPQTTSGMVEIMEGQGLLPKVETVSGRGNQPRDIANAVAFLLSDDAEQISGTVLDVGAFSHQGGVGQPRS